MEVNRSGMTCCPFHNDRNPSMKVDRRFYCFGCGADGDVIDFTARLFDLSKKGAAEKLSQDFSIVCNSNAPPRKISGKSDAQRYRDAEQHSIQILLNYLHLLRKWEKEYAPLSADSGWHPLIAEAVEKKEYVEYLLDVFLSGSIEERASWIAEHGKDVIDLEKRISKFTAGTGRVGHDDSGIHGAKEKCGGSPGQPESD